MPGPIVVIVPHDPELDPRVLWTIDLCASILPTHVIAVSSSASAATVDRRGETVIERIPPGGGTDSPPQPVVGTSGDGRAGWRTRLPIPGWVRRRRGAIRHFTTTLGYYSQFGGALEQRAMQLSLQPSVIVCHDIYALPAAVRLKRLWGCRLLYDSHEYWPEADLLAERWEELYTKAYERRLVRHVDTVVTVSPPLARLLERAYGIGHVITVPNACPSEPGVTPSASRPIATPVRFLLQGQASPRRGFEQVLDTWRSLEGTEAVLEVRCPANPYLEGLRREYSDLERAGRLEFPAAVRENELISAAARSDVGLIPYPAHSLNHVYACPNKLAQYMHAGLAVLSNDLAYVRSVLEEYGCGGVFDLDRPDSLRATVAALVRDRAGLQRMKEASVRAAETFNWEVQSRPYREALSELAGIPSRQETV